MYSFNKLILPNIYAYIQLGKVLEPSDICAKNSPLLKLLIYIFSMVSSLQIMEQRINCLVSAIYVRGEEEVYSRSVIM